MILPSKHLSYDRALLSVGGRILKILTRPRTVSALWEELKRQDEVPEGMLTRKITYDWFLLALDLLYTLGAIEEDGGLMTRRTA